MHHLKLLTRRIGQAANRYEPRGLPLAAGRSLLAVAQLSVVIFSPDDALFPDTSGSPKETRCAGVSAASLWCLAGFTYQGMLISRVLAIAVLGIVLSGFRPRWTCIPHWYASFSLATAMPISNGGDVAAQVATMLIIPLCIGD